MRKESLNGTWSMNGYEYSCTGQIPGSMYSFLLENKLMEDPYYRDNEDRAFEIANHAYEFSRTFAVRDLSVPVSLCCDGLDTLAEIFLNGTSVASTKNMHRSYRFPVNEFLTEGENTIRIVFSPVDPYIKEKDAKYPLHGSLEPLKGYGHIRKASCMMGWDWGPVLPDMGIWKDIYLLYHDSPEITETNITQRFAGDRVFLTVQAATDLPCAICVTLTSPTGEKTEIPANTEVEIASPMLWWPRGLGEQNLYTVEIAAAENGKVCDSRTKRIGLRTMKLVRERDRYGESFYHEVNGVAFFAMGADYIPMDSVFSRITTDRIKKLLEDCVFANFNAIRVWGGGYYPEEAFFDLCDEMGIVVFLDLMFACSMYQFDDEMKHEVTAEVAENLRRFRHHPSIAVISGNNEIEIIFSYLYDMPDEKAPYKQQYLDVFEGIFPQLVGELCPDIPYVSSSPSSCGHFLAPGDENYGDSHYWNVWHSNEPFMEYRKHYFRYLSEFGFQSFPSEKTIEAVTLPSDRNVFSYIMEKHQRNGAANGKILSYLSQTFLYPGDFPTLIYASQLLQAEAMKCGVEHMRRNRGRCMGTLYWQLNDIWPVASWASVDYYGRYKALHYYAKRFYSPLLISAAETGAHTNCSDVNLEASRHPIETKAQIVLTNDTTEDVEAEVRVMLRSSTGEILSERTYRVTLPKLSALTVDDLDFRKTDYFNNYVSFEMKVGGQTVSEGTALFIAPKHFNFRDPALSCKRCGNKIVVSAAAYAKSVEIWSPDCDLVLSDNFFDMNSGEKRVAILSGDPQTLRLRSVYDIR